MSKPSEQYAWLNDMGDNSTKWDFDIPAEFVSVDWVMDPQTEDLIPGDQLQNGMIVLVSSSVVGEPRVTRSLDKATNPYEVHRAYRTNRWCRVTNLHRNGYADEIISFIGVYADGTKFDHQYNVEYNWYVKKDSIPENDIPETLRQSASELLLSTESCTSTDAELLRDWISGLLEH